MDHNFVFNTLSLPAESSATAFTLLLDTMKGMLAVGTDDDRRALYSDQSLDLNSCIIAPDTTYANFLTQLGLIEEQDLQLALMEVDDKTPMVDFVTDEQFLEIASAAYYFPDEAYTGSIDILAMAWYLDATLLSVGTTAKWCANEVEFVEFASGKHVIAASFLRNISSFKHGCVLNQQYETISCKPIAETFLTCCFSANFLTWVDGLAADLQSRIRGKLALAEAKKFQGGKPLFDTLTGSDAKGLREMRFSAVQGGAVRILFDLLPTGKYAILVGFVKKSNSEGYEQAIKSALTLLKGM
jgi:hypothetical protein